MAFLKKRTRFKDGKKHEYYSLCESIRVSAHRSVQRDILHLGELNASQLAKWKRTIAVLRVGAKSFAGAIGLEAT